MRKARVIHFQVRKIIFRGRKTFSGKVFMGFMQCNTHSRWLIITDLAKTRVNVKMCYIAQLGGAQIQDSGAPKYFSCYHLSAPVPYSAVWLIKVSGYLCGEVIGKGGCLLQTGSSDRILNFKICPSSCIALVVAQVAIRLY